MTEVHIVEPSAVVARFFTRPKEIKRESAAQDRPVFENREFVEILYPGDRLGAPVFPADAQADTDEMGAPISYKQKYPAQYAAFLQNAEALDGLPLNNLGIDKARIAELHALNVKSVEQLAGLPETAWRKLGPGGDELVYQARAIIDRQRNGRDSAEIAAENAALKAELEMLRGQIETGDEFADMDDAAIKALIKDKTGEGVRGNPSRATLIRMAQEIGG